MFVENKLSVFEELELLEFKHYQINTVWKESTVRKLVNNLIMWRV